MRSHDTRAPTGLASQWGLGSVSNWGTDQVQGWIPMCELWASHFSVWVRVGLQQQRQEQLNTDCLQPVPPLLILGLDDVLKTGANLEMSFITDCPGLSPLWNAPCRFSSGLCHDTAPRAAPRFLNDARIEPEMKPNGNSVCRHRANIRVL